MKTEDKNSQLGWSKINRYFALTLALAAAVWLVIAAADLMSALAISALLAYVLNPIVNQVNKRGKLPRGIVVPLVYLASLAGIIALAVTLAPIVPAQVTSFVDEVQLLNTELEATFAEPFQFAGFEIEVPLNDLIPDLTEMTTASIQPDMVLGVIQAASTNLVWVLIILVTTYYLLLDWAKFRDWLINAAPDTHRNDAQLLYNEIREVWQLYMRGQLTLMIIIGVMTGVGLAAIGVPGAGALGFLAGLLDVILSVGPVVAMIIAAAFAWVSGSTFLPLSNTWVAVIVLGLFGIIQFAENVWLRPRIMGNRLHMHPAIVFVGVMGALALAGVLVALIIIPLMGSIMIVGRYVYCRIVDVDPWAGYKPLSKQSPSEKTAVSTAPTAVVVTKRRGRPNAKASKSQGHAG